MVQEAHLLLKYALTIEEHWVARCAEVLRQDAMASFLRDVSAHVPFYRKRVGTGARELIEFPIVTRSDHAAAPDQFRAIRPGPWDPRLRARTNGTLTTSLEVQFDPVGWYDINYGTLGAACERIEGLRERFVPAQPCLVMVLDGLYQPKAAFGDGSAFIPTLNAARLDKVLLGVSEEEDCRLVEHLRAMNITLLYGKGSVLLRLAELDEELASSSGRIRAFAILTSGEALYEDQRAEIEQWFGAKVLNAYVATESGLIGTECAVRSGIHVRSGPVHVEVLTPTGELSDCGSGEVVITNLMSRAQTFVRYRLGDWASIENGTCACGFSGQTIGTLRAREPEVLEIAGQTVPVSMFSDLMLGLRVSRFQVHQRGEAMPVVRWVPPSWTTESIGQNAQRIEAWLSERGWAGAIESVPVFELVAPGAKQRRFVHEVGSDRAARPQPTAASAELIRGRAGRSVPSALQDSISRLPGVSWRAHGGGVEVTWGAGTFDVPGVFHDRWVEVLSEVEALPLGAVFRDINTDTLCQQFVCTGQLRTLCSSAVGTFWVMGKVRDRWIQLGAVNGPLGVPSGEEVSTADGRGRIQHFEDAGTTHELGAIVVHSENGGPFAVYGGIYARWARAGLDRGAIGLPESNILDCGDSRGRFMHFSGGGGCRIYLTPRTGPVLVAAPFFEYWVELGREAGPLGYPMQEPDLTAPEASRVMLFERGVLKTGPEGTLQMVPRAAS